MADASLLKRFKNLMQGYIDQLRAMTPDIPILLLDGGLESQINALAKQLNWWEPFRRQDNGAWLTISSASGGSFNGAIMFTASEKEEKAWGRDKNGALRVPPGVVAEWNQRQMRLMLPPLLSWITKVDDALLTAENQTPPPADPSNRTAGSGPAACSHNADFTVVNWGGTKHHFSLGVQSSAVKALWDEWEKTGLGLHQATICKIIDAERNFFRMDKAFRGNAAFGTMIQSDGDGRYKLVAPMTTTPTAPKKIKQSARIPAKAPRKPR